MENRLFSLPDDLIYKIYKIYFTNNIISQINIEHIGRPIAVDCVIGYFNTDNEFWLRYLKARQLWEFWQYYYDDMMDWEDFDYNLRNPKSAVKNLKKRKYKIMPKKKTL